MHSPRGKAAMRRAYKKRDMRKHWVRMFTRAAIKIGVLHMEPCESCGKLPAEAHHEDYNEPLKVRWFCTDHHRDTGHGGSWKKPPQPNSDAD